MIQKCEEYFSILKNALQIMLLKGSVNEEYSKNNFL
jgi:hypothetical protein